MSNDKTITPKIKVGAMAGKGPIRASAEQQQPLGFPKEKVADWQNVAIAKIGEIKKNYRSVQLFLDICVKCGACSDKCHYFLGTADPKNMPVARQDLLRSVYRRYYTIAGKFLPKLVGAKDLTSDLLDEWHNYFHQCSQCRRCAVFCPYGIDTAELSMATRQVLNSVGIGQKYSNQILGKHLTIGSNLGLPEAALKDILADLEAEIKAETGVSVALPLDKKGADVLLLVPSADFFAEPHVDGLIGYAKVLHQAGIRWTLSTQALEAANFGLFIGDYQLMKQAAMQIRRAVLDLGVKRVVVGECGHAWRVASEFWHTLIGLGSGALADDEDAQRLQKQLDHRYPQPQHMIELTYDLIQQNRLVFDKGKNDQHIVTFHDSCNIARGSPLGGIKNGQFILPRAVIKAVCHHFVEMPKSTTGVQTFCCGAGAGLLSDDLATVRIKGALPRMMALKKVRAQQQVNTLAAMCAICKSQFSQTLPHYDFEPTMVVSVHQLVANALVLKVK